MPGEFRPDDRPAVDHLGPRRPRPLNEPRTSAGPARPMVDARGASRPAGSEVRHGSHARPVRRPPAFATSSQRRGRSAARKTWRGSWPLWLSLIYVSLTGLVYVLLEQVSEEWWLSAALVYLPRSPYLLPAGLLLPWALFRRSVAGVLCNLVALGLVGGPIMGLSWSAQAPAPQLGYQRSDQDLVVVSCNVQGYAPNFELVLAEIAALNPDVIALQEAFGDRHPLLKTLQDWQILEINEYIVASKYPLRLVRECPSVPFDRVSGIEVEVLAPQGSFQLFNIHQTSPRPGLKSLKWYALFAEKGHQQLDHHMLLRDEEARALREFVAVGSGDRPHLVMGDFNMPADSSLFRSYWGDLQNTFFQGGRGYGYTAPCDVKTIWPNGLPWSRVDHILASDGWQVVDCTTGEKNGSDHRLVAARLRRVAAP